MAKELKPMEDMIKLSFEEVKAATRAAVRRARQLETRYLKNQEMPATSPALAAARETKPKGQASLFEIGRKDRNELLREYKRAKSFIEAKTSTVKGAREFYKNVKEGFEKELGIDLPDDPIKIQKLLSTLDKIMELPNVSGDRKFKYALMEEITETAQNYPELNKDELFNVIENRLEEIYIEYQKKQDPFANIPGYDI